MREWDGESDRSLPGILIDRNVMEKEVLPDFDQIYIHVVIVQHFSHAVHARPFYRLRA